jgi:hypothetical protein
MEADEGYVFWHIGVPLCRTAEMIDARILSWPDDAAQENLQVLRRVIS